MSGYLMSAAFRIRSYRVDPNYRGAQELHSITDKFYSYVIRYLLLNAYHGSVQLVFESGQCSVALDAYSDRR